MAKVCSVGCVGFLMEGTGACVVGLITGGNEEEYRDTIENFVEWSKYNNLHLNTSKTKEIVVDFRRGRRTQPTPVSIGGTVVEMVANHRYLGVLLDSGKERGIFWGWPGLFFGRVTGDGLSRRQEGR